MGEYKLSITIDIEDWYHVPSITGSPYSIYKDVPDFFKKWSYRYDYLTETTKKVLDILNEYNLTATFFVVADVVNNYPGLVESIVKDNHEIGCHGLHHACKIDPITKSALMSEEEFKKVTLNAKKVLEKVYGKKVVGYRAPNGFIGKWMFNILYNIGFLYDSSISVNTLYNKTDFSLKDISSHPYYPIKDNQNFLEFPWAYWDILGFKIQTSGGPMLRFLGANIILKGLKQSLKRGHTIFYFHPIDISDEKFPQITNKKKFFWIFKGNIIENRIRYIIENLRKNDIEITCIKDIIS